MSDKAQMMRIVIAHRMDINIKKRNAVEQHKKLLEEKEQILNELSENENGQFPYETCMRRDRNALELVELDFCVKECELEIQKIQNFYDSYPAPVYYDVTRELLKREIAINNERTLSILRANAAIVANELNRTDLTPAQIEQARQNYQNWRLRFRDTQQEIAEESWSDAVDQLPEELLHPLELFANDAFGLLLKKEKQGRRDPQDQRKR